MIWPYLAGVGGAVRVTARRRAHPAKGDPGREDDALSIVTIEVAAAGQHASRELAPPLGMLAREMSQ